MNATPRHFQFLAAVAPVAARQPGARVPRVASPAAGGVAGLAAARPRFPAVELVAEPCPAVERPAVPSEGPRSPATAEFVAEASPAVERPAVPSEGPRSRATAEFVAGASPAVERPAAPSEGPRSPATVEF